MDALQEPHETLLLAVSLQPVNTVFASFDIPLSWGELLKRTAKETSDDDCLGLAAQLAYYFFLALFPAILFLIALASFFPLTNFTDDLVRTLRPIAPADVLTFLEDQLRRISDTDSGGILTLGILGAIWSSSAAVIAIIGSLNRAHDIEEGRPWWKVRLTAIGSPRARAARGRLLYAHRGRPQHCRAPRVHLGLDPSSNGVGRSSSGRSRSSW
jgi:hypothetical protein